MNRMIITLAASMFSTSLIASDCLSQINEQTLNSLKTSKFEIASDEKRNQVALSMLACLDHENPAIRDGVVFEGVSKWLRDGSLSEITTNKMYLQLFDIIIKPNTDVANFRQPFAILLFSEVIRGDRIKPFLSASERQKAVQLATRFMTEIEDYRGFDENDGWRHSVAHTADVFLQLALNPEINKEQLDLMLTAAFSQVNPNRMHFYRYGEPKRLAMSVIYMILRGEHSVAELEKRFSSMLSSEPFNSWQSMYSSDKGLAKLHNTRAFIYAMYAITGHSSHKELQKIQPMLREAIKTLG